MNLLGEILIVTELASDAEQERLQRILGQLGRTREGASEQIRPL
jgi:hypothetical protein